MPKNLASAAEMEHLLNTYVQAVRRMRVLQCSARKQCRPDHREQLAQAAAEVDDLTNLHLLEPPSAESMPAPSAEHVFDQWY